MEKIKYYFNVQYNIHGHWEQFRGSTRANSIRKALSNISYQIKNERKLNAYVKILITGNVDAIYGETIFPYEIKNNEIKGEIENELATMIEAEEKRIYINEQHKLWVEHQKETLGEDYEEWLY